MHDHAAGPLENVHKGLGELPAVSTMRTFSSTMAWRKPLDGAVGLGVWEQGEVDAEGLIRQGFQQLDVLLKGLGGVVGGHIDGAQPPGVGDSGGQRAWRAIAWPPWMIGYSMPNSSVILVFMVVPLRQKNFFPYSFGLESQGFQGLWLCSVGIIVASLANQVHGLSDTLGVLSGTWKTK